MECEITHSMFSIRMVEINIPWLKNKEEIILALEDAAKSIQVYYNTEEKITELANQKSRLCDLQNYIGKVQKELDTAALEHDHPINTLPDRYVFVVCKIQEQYLLIIMKYVYKII